MIIDYLYIELAMAGVASLAVYAGYKAGIKKIIFNRPIVVKKNIKPDYKALRIKNDKEWSSLSGYSINK